MVFLRGLLGAFKLSVFKLVLLLHTDNLNSLKQS